MRIKEFNDTLKDIPVDQFTTDPSDEEIEAVYKYVENSFELNDHLRGQYISKNKLDIDLLDSVIQKTKKNNYNFWRGSHLRFIGELYDIKKTASEDEFFWTYLIFLYKFISGF